MNTVFAGPRLYDAPRAFGPISRPGWWGREYGSVAHAAFCGRDRD